MALSQIVDNMCNVESLQLGVNIAANQADVECAAVLLRDMPLNSAGFAAMKGDREWVSMQICVVAVGPPGFSSVPYTASKKKGEKEANPERLYEVTETGTRFYPFEKGRTNKDKGRRVSEMDVDGGDGELTRVNATAVIEPGMCLTNFVREENFSDSRFVMDAPDGDTLKAGSLVFVQLSSQNIEQAKKGFLIKFRRVKPLRGGTDAVAAWLASPDFVKSEAEVEARQAMAKNIPALTKQCYGGNLAVFNLYAKPSGFISYDADRNTFVMSECCDDIEEIEVCVEVVYKATGCVDPVRAMRYLNVAICTGAVSMLLFHTKAGGVVMASGSPDQAVWLYINHSKMLSSQTLQSCVDRGVNAYDQSDKKFCVGVTDDEKLVMWSNRTNKMSTSRGPRDVIFSLKTDQKFLSDAWNCDYIGTKITDGTAGGFYPLDMWLVEADETWDCSKPMVESSSMKHVITLQLHTHNNGVSKRKRPVDPCGLDGEGDPRQMIYAGM